MLRIMLQTLHSPCISEEHDMIHTVYSYYTHKLWCAKNVTNIHIASYNASYTASILQSILTSSKEDIGFMLQGEMGIIVIAMIIHFEEVTKINRRLEIDSLL